ncbi:MAG: LysM peptidoglycan-binding domain-containing protein [Candidatus Sericytochromatia bacterium]|nr:LysM peptidoglycan-binding domain-containing protein [Candidatus Sericytochromatia bacterium]
MSRIDGRPVTPTTPPTGKTPPTPSPTHTSPAPNAPSQPPTNSSQPNLSTVQSSPQGSALAQLSFEPPTPQPSTHTVKRGESLSSIANKYFGNANLYMELYKVNRDILSHPNALHTGMTLKLPTELFPAATDKGRSPVPTGPSFNAYRQENPLSYITLGGKEKPGKDQPSNAGTPQVSGFVGPPAPPRSFEHFFEAPDRLLSGGQNLIEHDDAVKVNKTFDLQPGMTLKNFKTQLPGWADKLATVLAENKASIKLPTPDGAGTTVDSRFFTELSRRVKAGEYEAVKKEFGEKFGVGFVNTLLALDDVAFNIKNDPYYSEYKSAPKTIDLASVQADFNLSSDKLNYLAHTAAHKHKQVPVQLQMDPAALQQATTTQSADELIKDLGSYFNSKGTLTKPKEFEEKVYKLLDDPVARRRLVEKFKLNSEANLQALVPAITGEAGMASSQIDYNSYLAVGSVMMNRALGRNLKKAAMMSAQGKPAEQFKPVSMKDIVREEGQFEIVWRPMPNSGGKTFYQFNEAQNQAFLNGKLKVGGNSHNAFSMAYEVAKDIFAGTNRLAADVNGTTQKGAGRSIGDLFFFNQSRSQDYSNGAGASVAYVDTNNTQVFFKTWNKDTPYF